jgi:probable F420-dependent oxidoreductase
MAFAREKARFGVTMFPTEYAIPPVDLARAVEERGLDSLFFPEHTHIPASRKTPFPGGGELPKQYYHTYDPFVAFGACAAVTKRIRLGTGICLVIQRDPITLAKEIASLDALSNGRFVFGIGAGWNQDEMENHGANYAMRWEQVREKVLAMKAIWRDELAEFHGKHVDFDPIFSYPKPAQKNGPPVWIGASSKWVFDRVAEYADGWMPIGGLGSGNLERLKVACEKRGRRVEDITIGLFGAPTSLDSLRGRIDQGFDELIFNLPSEPADKTLPRLDEIAQLVRRVRG